MCDYPGQWAAYLAGRSELGREQAEAILAGWLAGRTQVDIARRAECGAEVVARTVALAGVAHAEVIDPRQCRAVMTRRDYEAGVPLPRRWIRRPGAAAMSETPEMPPLTEAAREIIRQAIRAEFEAYLPRIERRAELHLAAIRERLEGKLDDAIAAFQTKLDAIP